MEVVENVSVGDDTETCSLQSLCDENRMLGKNLRETVTNLEKKKIQLVAKRDQLQAHLNWQFEKVTNLKRHSEELLIELEKTKSELDKQVSRREQLREKNGLIDEAFSAQLIFQEAINEKFTECEHDMKESIFKDQQTLATIERDWSFFNTKIKDLVAENRRLKSQIEEAVAKQKVEVEMFGDNMRESIVTLNDAFKQLSQAMNKCVDLKNAINELPMDSYKNSVAQGEEERANLQEKIHAKKINFSLKVAEIDRKIEEKRNELKQLTEELNKANEDNLELSSDIEKAKNIINEKTQKIELLNAACEQQAKALANHEAELKVKENERDSLKAELEDLKQVEESNDKLQEEIKRASAVIESDKEVHAQQLVELEKLTKKKCDLNAEIGRVGEEVDKQHQENRSIELILGQIQEQIDDCIAGFSQRKKEASDNVWRMQSSIEQVEQQMSELKLKNDAQLELITSCKKELQQFQSLNDEKTKEAEILREKLKVAKERHELDQVSNRIKLQEMESAVKKLDNEISGYTLVINGDLALVPQEYERLVSLEASMTHSFRDEKDAITTKHSNDVQQINTELKNLQSTYDAWFEALDKKAATIKEELKKQVEKNSKYESQCNTIQGKIRQKEKKIEELQNQVVRRELKLQKARNAAVITRKEISQL